MRILILTNFITGLILALISLPLMTNKIKPNGFYGFRTRRTLENPQIWYKTNEYAGKQLFTAGIFISLFSAGITFIPGLDSSTYSIAGLIALVAALITATIRSMLYLNSLDE
jgi:uncharacterized membrane protein